MPSIKYCYISGFYQNKKQDEKILLDKIFSIIFFITNRYLGLPKAKIVQIYKNCFKLKNFYKFCYFKDCKNKNRDKIIIFEHNKEKIKKVTNILYDFCNIIYIWLNNFLHYFIIIIDFFEIAFFFLF